MSNIKFVYPNEAMESYANEFKNEFLNNGENIINGGLKLDNIENYNDWLKIVKDSFSAETVNTKWGVHGVSPRVKVPET